ncbi:hypothetical protein [Pelagicoccus albus]|uniref:Uncharacterized protein n=1 Tax=Pelagicoccus albus TaxID=415222 RepID=A0A7X1B8M7_9BACT|nr:hypothetical protein [Pelagicoccus albus]MBC2607688.1 hypothetical protein [Pelagicoccus albus]
MKRSRISKFTTLFVALAFAAIAASSVHAAEKVTINATLIIGSNDGGGVDAPLRQYEKNLKRVLPFDTFKRQGGGRASIYVPGRGSIGLGGGQNVGVSAESAGEGRYRISAQWKRGNQTMVNTTVVASKNRPTVLVGGGQYILILIAN